MTSCGNHLAGGLLQHALAVVRGLQLGRAGGRELDQLVVEEGHPALQPPGHRHVVDPLHRVVDQHHGGVQPQRPIGRGGRAGMGEVREHELPGDVGVEPPSRLQQPVQRVVVAVEERRADSGDKASSDVVVGGVRHRRVPVVAGEDLVGALPRLHHLDVLADLLGQQVERHAVVAHHRLAHRPDGATRATAACGRCRCGSGGGRCRSGGR